MEGMWMHSKPVFVSRYWTCMRSSTRLMSVWMTCGDFVDVVATLVAQSDPVLRKFTKQRGT